VRFGGVLGLLCAALIAPIAASASGFSTYQPATVDPAVSRPDGKRCTVVLLHDHGFGDFSPVHTQYSPPAQCPGPWAKVVLDFDTRVKGVQYDRIGMLWIGRDEVLRFSTAEPTRAGIRYHIEKDVSTYAPLLTAPRLVTTLLGNLVNKEYTGIFYVTATLTFYQGARPSPAAPDAILAVDGQGKDTPSVDSGRLVKTLSALPRNIVHAVLDVYVTNHACDEFWYSNQPDAYAAAHKKDGLCGGNAYREIDVSIDGKPASVIYPFPYIWTGGVNPLLWRPLSAIRTLDVPAYAVDLDPWAGVLSDGKAHAVGLSVLDDRGTWPMDANLLLWTDAHRTRTGGALVEDTIASSAPTSTSERQVGAGRRFWIAANRDWRVSGYVDTSAGRVWHSIESHMHFWNLQYLNLGTGEGDATQTTSFTTVTTTRDKAGTRVRTQTTSYPLVANATYPLPQQMKPYTLVIYSEVHQGLMTSGSDGACEVHADATATLKRIKADVDALAVGRTSESNVCSGALGNFSIRKTAVNGALLP